MVALGGSDVVGVLGEGGLSSATFVELSALTVAATSDDVTVAAGLLLDGLVLWLDDDGSPASASSSVSLSWTRANLEWYLDKKIVS